MRLTFNKNDWSGEEATINVNQKTRSWSQNGYRVTLELRESGAQFASYNIVVDQGIGYCGTVCGFSGEEYAAEDNGHNCSRYDASPFIAASQLLFNIV